MTKSEFKAIEKAMNELGAMRLVGLDKHQIKAVNTAYRGLWNVLTENGSESLASMALRLGV